MKHFGDITKLNGHDLPPVDVITGGSPCQDLSIAGKRAGLDGERSGLFMEQIRVVKEMREQDVRNGRAGFLIRPRYMVWENVPGAFSSNGGKDFQAVLTEIVRVAVSDAPDVPMPQKGRWPKAGYLYDELGGWSVAWRVHDAQYWGVPQRRKRICVLADFNGLSAAEILFDPKLERTTERGEPLTAVGGFGNEPRSKIQTECESVSGNIEPSGAEGQGAAGSTEDGIEETDLYALEGNGASPSHRGGGYNDSGISFTLNAVEQHAISFCERAGKPGGGQRNPLTERANRKPLDFE